MVESAESHRTAIDSPVSTTVDEERALVARAKQDPEVFAILYRRYVGQVYRYCYHRLGTREAAEDATAEVFAKALAALPRCRDDRFRAWLFVIARNVVVDGYRARPRTEQLSTARDLPDAAPSPEEMAVAAADRGMLESLLAQLAPDQRRVLELRLSGLTDAEIGRVLQRSRGAVRAAQYRGVTRLRALLGIGREEATGDAGE